MQNPRSSTLVRWFAAPVTVSLLVLAACSSSDSGTPATSTADGGPLADGSPAADGASLVDGSMPGADAAVVTDGGAAGPCAFSLAGGFTAPTTNAPNGCSNSKIESLTMVHGTQHPNDVFYLFDLTLSGTVEGTSMGATEVTIEGTFASTMPPLGS